MANKKRDKNGYRKQLERYRLTRKDLLVIEKILWTYADAKEMARTDSKALSHNRKHMPRKSVDRYASVGRYNPFHLSLGWNEAGTQYPSINWVYREDSVKFLSGRGYPKRTSYLELAAWPGIKVTFTPLSTTIFAQTHYATGKELMVMRKVAHSIEEYLLKADKSLINVCKLRK